MVTARAALGVVLGVGLTTSACGALIGIGDPELDRGDDAGVGAVADAEAGAKPDSGPATDSATDAASADAAPTPGTTCSVVTCKSPELCCIHAVFSGGQPPQVTIQDAKCQTTACTKTTNTTGTLRCDDTVDCPGQKCCLTVTFSGTGGGSMNADSTCAASCGAGSYQMCGASSECAGGSCLPVFGPYKACR